MSSDSGLVRISHMANTPARVVEEVPPNCVKVYAIKRHGYYLVRKDQIIAYKSETPNGDRKNSSSPNARNDVRGPSRNQTQRESEWRVAGGLPPLVDRSNSGTKRVRKNATTKRTVRETGQSHLEF